MNPLTRTIAALSGALIAASTSVLPAMARIDSGSGDLIRKAERYGATFVDGSNSAECTGNIHGWYNHGTKTIVLCRLNQGINAELSDTLRHEVFHFIQGCQSSGAQLEPLMPRQNFIYFVERSLTPGQIDSIKMTYPQGKWATEMEAFAMAKDMSAATLSIYLDKYCG